MSLVLVMCFILSVECGVAVISDSSDRMRIICGSIDCASYCTVVSSYLYKSIFSCRLYVTLTVLY